MRFYENTHNILYFRLLTYTLLELKKLKKIVSKPLYNIKV